MDKVYIVYGSGYKESKVLGVYSNEKEAENRCEHLNKISDYLYWEPLEKEVINKTKDGNKLKLRCPNGHNERFIAKPRDFELPYYVDKNGNATGYRYDGIKGITDEQRKIIENTDNVFCSFCLEQVDFIRE